MRKLLITGISVLWALAVVACGDSGTDKAMAPPPSASEDATADKMPATEPAKPSSEQAARQQWESAKAKRDAERVRQAAEAEARGKAEARRRAELEARVAAEAAAGRAAEKAADEAAAAATKEVAAADRDEAPARAPAPEAEIAAAPEPSAGAAPMPPAAANGKSADHGALSRSKGAGGGAALAKRRSYKYMKRSSPPKKVSPGDGISSLEIGGGSTPGAPSRSVGRGLAPAPPPANLESMPVQPPAAPESLPDVAAPAVPPADLESLAVQPPLASEPPSGAVAPAPAAPPVAAAPKSAQKEPDWSVVPIFFGTDRQRTNTTTRVIYDWQRGRRLELGQALVTIPKKHEVPMVERPWALKIPYLEITLYEEAEDPKEHFTLKEIKALTKEQFLALVREKLAASTRFKDHALVFVHGYQTKFDNAVFRTAQIAYDLKFDGASFLYSWPSGGTLQGYTYDLGSAAQAEPYLREFLQLVRDESGAKKLSVIAHSMGNQPLLRVLQDLKRSLPEGVLISQLILAAPDVDRDNFENIVTSIRGIAEGITLYAASNDTALQVSRQVNGGVPRAGDVPEGGPIVIEGIDTIDATATSMDSVGINHSGYAENNALLLDIGKLIGEGVRPPGVRLPTLERVETEKGAYWRYPAASAQ